MAPSRPVRALAFALLACAAAAPAASPADPTQAARIAAISYAQTTAHITSPLVVDPIAFAGSYALADWNAARRQGQVLLVTVAGHWRVVAMENSVLANARYLRQRYHVPAAQAALLVERLNAAEKREGTRP
jgi:hypothetical protein